MIKQHEQKKQKKTTTTNASKIETLARTQSRRTRFKKDAQFIHQIQAANVAARSQRHFASSFSVFRCPVEKQIRENHTQEHGREINIEEEKKQQLQNDPGRVSIGRYLFSRIGRCSLADR